MLRKICLFLATIVFFSAILVPQPSAFSIESSGQSTLAAKKKKESNTTTTKKNKKDEESSDTTTTENNGAVFTGTCRDGFLGLVSWDCNVDIHDEASLKAGIWNIVANIATDITIIAAYLVLGYVIYGGYLYIFSSGDAGKVANGKKTLTHAFIGLAIVMSAYIIMSAIRIALLGGDKSLSDCVTSSCINANDLIISAVNWVIGIAGVVAAIFVVYGGILYMTSSGDPGKIQKAKQTIIYALIGLAIVALAEAITAFVSGMIRDANNNATSTLYHQSITPKESHEIQII